MTEEQEKKELSVNEKFALNINEIMNGIKHLSYSAISKFLKSPRHFKEYKTGKFEVTKAMEEGRMFHMACLEPDKFKEKYWVLDDSAKCIEIGGKSPRSTKAYKEWVVEQDLLNIGKDRIAQDLYYTFLNMSQSLQLNSATKELMCNLIETEEQFEFNHDGFSIKGAIDGFGSNSQYGNYCIDLKKVADAQFKRVKWDIKDMNYDMQGAIYSKVKSVQHYFLVYIDKSCNITVVKLSKAALETGFEKFESALSNFDLCAQTNSWNASYEFYNGGLINF